MSFSIAAIIGYLSRSLLPIKLISRLYIGFVVFMLFGQVTNFYKENMQVLYFSQDVSYRILFNSKQLFVQRINRDSNHKACKLV